MVIKLNKKNPLIRSLYSTKFKPKIDNFKIYRVFPDGSNEYLHPKDGVFPEKVNEGRPYAGKIDRSIGSNPEPAAIKFTGKNSYDP